jgi:transcriptional regulator with XRE-family HTH domain
VFASLPKTRHQVPVAVDDDLVGFGERVRIARERLDMSQVALAAVVGTDSGTISRWERGRGYPQAPQLARLTLALGESLDYLVLGASTDRAPAVMPPAFLAFLRTDLGRIAQERAYIATLLSVRTLQEPTIRFYQAIVSGLMMDDPG